MQYEERTRIATPEGVELELVLAGLASRFIAELFDGALILLMLAATIALAVLVGGAGGFVLVSIALGGVLLISVAYNVAFEVLAAGRTPGKRWTGLRVVMEGGEPIGFRASAIRNLIRLIEGLPLWYVPAIVSILVTKRNQRLGDLAANTLVVREPRPPRRKRDQRPRARAAASGAAARRLGRLRGDAGGPRRRAHVHRPPRRASHPRRATASPATSPGG